MRETQRKGDIAKARAVSTFTALGYDVSFLLTESASYDLIVDDGRLNRVQCKYISGDVADLRRIHTNSKGYVVKKNQENDYDWLYVLANKGEYLYKECFSNRRSLKMKPENLLNLVAE